MTAKPEDLLTQAWKQQLDIGLRAMEALVEGTARLRQMQLEAATAAHADLDSARKSLAATSDLSRLMELQAQWTRANAERCADYWRKVHEVAVQTQAQLAGCWQVRQPAASPVDPSKQALFTLMDSAYKQWLDATQQFYKPPTAPGARPQHRAAA